MSAKERLRSLELDPQTTRAFAETFIPRWDCYPLQLQDGSYIQKREPLTLPQVVKHLTHARLGLKPFTLGAYALDRESNAHWVCFDADADEQWEQLQQLARTLSHRAVPSYLEQSRRGGHLWLFTPKLPGTDIRRFASALLAKENISEVDEQRKRRIEIYPKQDVLGEGSGSFVRLPLGVHLKTGQFYHFVDLDVQPLAPSIREQIQMLSQPERVPGRFIKSFLSREVQVFPPPLHPPTFKKYTPQRNEPLSESLKHATSLYDFVSHYVPLNEQGRGLCPFHDDHKKSFGVNRGRDYWHCFAGCGGGSLIDFWMKWREMHGQDSSFVETVKELRGMLLK